MTPRERVRRLLHRIAVEETTLAGRAARGDRDAFDALFDRYCARMAHAFRALPDVEAKAKLWEALEQVFAGLDCDSATPLAARAFRVAKSSLVGRPGRAVHTAPARRKTSAHER